MVLDDRAKLQRALEHFEVLFKDACTIQCQESLANSLCEGEMWSSRHNYRTKVDNSDELRSRLHQEGRVNVFTGLAETEPGSEEPVMFPLVRFKGLDEEEGVPLPQGPHPLLLSFRSMNAMTNFFYGNLPDTQSLLFMSCYNMAEGMPLDCETCLQNAFGEDYDEEEHYMMGPDCEIMVAAEPLPRSKPSLGTPDSDILALSGCTGNLTCDSASSGQSESSAASTVPRELFASLDLQL